MGLVFTVNKDGRGYSVLHSFTNALGDGANPNAALIEGSDGALYGTTLRGGIGSLGTVFRIGKDGSGYSVLHGFTNNPDGTVPSTPLLEGSDGVLYGTSGQGGSNDAGIVFKLHKDGNGYVILHSFNYSTDGGYPGSGLLEGSDGTLYGTTSAGGSGFGGTLFKINKNGSDFLVLQSFGSLGVVELLKGRDGTLYGTLYGNGGATVKVFKINQDGSGFTVLSTGALGPIVETRDGSLYGSTFFGGPTCKGTIFALFPEPRSWFTGWSATLNGIDSFSALAAAGVSFRLQSAADFAKPAWSDVSTNIANRSGALSFTNLPGAGPHLFYRLVAP